MSKWKITIWRDGCRTGEGFLTEDLEIVCPAVLGPDPAASDETYEAICDAISDEPQDAGRYTGTGEIVRPDGVYSWRVEIAD